jgi:catechol 2,3-dioxygenase-like lactoylglutathione lyase family enzyme
MFRTSVIHSIFLTNNEQSALFMLKIDGITHWAIAVNDLDEAEKFYRDILGFDHKGRLGDSGMSAFFGGGSGFILCLQNEPVYRTLTRNGGLHYAFTVDPDKWVQFCKLLYRKKVEFDELIYREKGVWTGRELYFFDPSGNRLELRDPTWKVGMPKPSFEEIAKA